MSNLIVYDTTLRDGTQGEEISFSIEDKLRIAESLGGLGVSYIEGGWPGSNPRDAEFFERVRKAKLGQTKIAAFGSTRRPGASAEQDTNLRALVAAATPAVTIFGKSWRMHAEHALSLSAQENADLIASSVAFLCKHVDEVFYDAEHFFDGWSDDPAYALAMITAASQAGAKTIILCDTNGGSLPERIRQGVMAVRNALPSTQLGIHCHNDGELAVANTLTAIEAGVSQVQGTINGIGERCGNVNLISVIANAVLKLGRTCAVDPARLRHAAAFVAEVANRPLAGNAPFVGASAFAHKGGIHVSAVLKDARMYEHVEPEAVGNQRRFLISDLSGRASILAKAKELGIDLDAKDPVTVAVLTRLKELEAEGYQFEGADASFELLLLRAQGKHHPAFELVGYRVLDERRAGQTSPTSSEATVQVEVGGEREHTAANGDGPVNALDRALRKALETFYPQLRQVHLVDYKVRVLPQGKGTGSVVRVLIESSDGDSSWSTVGVNENILEASFLALVDAIEFKLVKDARSGQAKGKGGRLDKKATANKAG